MMKQFVQRINLTLHLLSFLKLGNAKKCFVCCQYDGCNAVPLHNRYSSESSDETEFEFLNEATIYSSSRWITGTLVFLQVMLWMTT